MEKYGEYLDRVEDALRDGLNGLRSIRALFKGEEFDGGDPQALMALTREVSDTMETVAMDIDITYEISDWAKEHARMKGVK